MEHIERSKKTIYFYKAKAKSKLAQFNHIFSLPEYFGPMIGDKKNVTLADIGAGPVSTTGSIWPTATIHLYASDVLEPVYKKYYPDRLISIEYQDMENLTYEDNFFDIVHCVNALDHTPNARKALNEMIRVCKPGGFIYLRHSPDQKTRYRGQHEWNAGEEKGLAYFMNGIDFTNDTDVIHLTEFKTHLEGDLIVSIWQKPI